jgi:hypothetical protein
MSRPPTRRELQRALALNAATKPLNVLAPAGVLVAALLVGTMWLVAVALVTWLALLVTTFFDEREATAVGERLRAARRAPALRLPPLVPALARRWDAALAARASIQRDGDAPLLMHEVEALVEALRPSVAQAQRIDDALLRSTGPARERLRARLDQLLDEIDQVVATLETVHAEILVSDQDELIADLRARRGLLATDEPAA